MQKQSDICERRANGQPVYKRYFEKNDGRPLYLYGYQPHSAEPLPQMEPVHNKPASLRYHPLREEWSIYAAHRQSRTFQPKKTAAGSGFNPLAPAKPGTLPTEIPFADFEVAVFENRFSSLMAATGDAIEKIAPGVASKQATGRCEVIVYSSEEEGSLATFSQSRRRLIVEALIDRYQALRAAGHAYILAFENRGAEVGATLHHPHGQIYAFDFVPEPQAKAAKAFSSGYDLQDAQREWGDAFTVSSGDHMAITCPPYARFPYEAWIIPSRRIAGPWEMNDAETEDFAEKLGEMVRRYDAFFGRPTPFMMTHHVSPGGFEDSFYFTTQFYPLLRSADKLKYFAGVEQATGVFTVDVLPEDAVAALRDVL